MSGPSSKNAALIAAAASKNDEFYTQLADIENELRHYKAHFRGKVVYCNCDDPTASNFFRYFLLKFADLGLKRLIATGYRSGDPHRRSLGETESTYRIEYGGFRDGEQAPNPEDIGVRPLRGNGDFRSRESIALLREADIVVTNPPFSLFREYVAQLMEHGKRFLIVGSQNAITYKDIFPLIKEGRLWLGYGFRGGNAYFGVPPGARTQDYAAGVYDEQSGLVKFRNVTWFTNLDHAKRHEALTLFRRYTPDEYPHYDNYDAINVDKVADIPKDWDGAIGVPITFLDKYNPDQFSIVGITDRDNNSGLKTKEYTSADVANPGDLNRRGVIKMGGRLKPTYVRLLVRRNQSDGR